MKARIRFAIRCVLAASLLACTAATRATQAGETTQGWPYVSGGVSHEERAALHAQGSGYSLWVVTAAMKSGAYLSDVRVMVRDAKQRVVFDGRLDGPWLFIDLPLGRYEVEAAFSGQARQRVTTIHRGDHHQALFYFDTGDH
ncbi:MAG: carboxypeptidase regulatory-like domain-containing protein [Burkholderiaceae bacterium]